MKFLQSALLLAAALPAACANDSSASDSRRAGDDQVNDTQNASDQSHVTFRPVRDPKSRSSTKKEKLVEVQVFPLYDKLPRGEKCLVAIELKIKDGWHIHANPAHPKFTIPTEVKLTTNSKIRMTKVHYPKHHLHRMKDEEEDSHVYNGTILVYGLLEIDPAEDADKAELVFHVGYQACTDIECRRPEKIVMKGKLPVADPGDEIKKINEEKFPQAKADAPTGN